MAYESSIVDKISDMVSFIAPLEILPGGDENKALSDGVYSMLTGEEKLKKLSFEQNKELF